MSDCCVTSLDAKFDARHAEQQARAYRRSGPARETQLLIDGLRDAGVDGARVLDIGGGIGAVQLGLLSAGARSVVSVEASSGSIDAARALAREDGHGERVEYRRGDFIDLAPEIPQVDVVTLDKVICCYPAMEALVERSAARAARLYAAVYPRNAAYIRVVNRVQNVFRGLVRLAGPDGGEAVEGSIVSGNFFDVLQVRPAIGRFFLPEEDMTPRSHPVVVLSHSFWRDRFDSDPDIVGRGIVLNASSFTVVGVAAEGFRGPVVLAPDLWAPVMAAPLLGMEEGVLTGRRNVWLRAS